MKTKTTPLDTLKTVFGYSAFRPHQEEIIEGVIGGEDAFVSRMDLDSEEVADDA